MQKSLLVLFLASTSVYAGPVDRAVRDAMKNDVRTTRHVVTDAEQDTVCTAAGDTIVSIQVKESFRRESGGTISTDHRWKTVKTFLVTPEGQVMEDCYE